MADKLENPGPPSYVRSNYLMQLRKYSRLLKDRVVPDTLEPSQFHLGIDLAYYAKIGAQFNGKTKTLVVTINLA